MALATPWVRCAPVSRTDRVTLKSSSYGFKCFGLWAGFHHSSATIFIAETVHEMRVGILVALPYWNTAQPLTTGHTDRSQRRDLATRARSSITVSKPSLRYWPVSDLRMPVTLRHNAQV